MFNIEIVENGYIVRTAIPEGRKSLASDTQFVYSSKTAVSKAFDEFVAAIDSAEVEQD
jgi:hypothetical protein